MRHSLVIQFTVAIFRIDKFNKHDLTDNRFSGVQKSLC